MKLNLKIETELQNLEERGNLRTLKTLDSTLINFSSNDYLGLASDTQLRKEFFSQFSDLPLSSSSSRLLTGSYPLVMELEREIESIYGKSALIFNSGFDSNQCVIETLFPKDTLIITDRLNHASIYAGILATENRFLRYRHLDYGELEKLLIKHKDEYENILVISETIYSMDGDIGNIEKLLELKRKYSFKLMIDEAHSYGVHGYGIAHSLGVVKEIDYLVIPLGKGGGSFGSYLITDELSKNYLINRGKQFIYTTALPPINIGWNLFILKNMPNFSHKMDHLRSLTEFTHSELKKLGIATDSTSHIISIIIGDNIKCQTICEKLKRHGYLLFPIKEPTVPKGSARIRVSLTADMNFQTVKKFLEVVKYEFDTIF